MKKGKFKGAILACSLLAFGAIITTTTFGLTSCGQTEEKPTVDPYLKGVTAFEITNKTDFDSNAAGYAWYPGDADKEIKLSFTGAEVNLLKAFQNKHIEITSSNPKVASVINNYVAPVGPGEAKITILVHTDKSELKQELNVKVLTPVPQPEAKKVTIKELNAMSYDAWLASRPQQDYIVTGTVVDWYRDSAPTKYGNFNIKDDEGNTILVYGATLSESALTYGPNGTWKFSNPQDFLDKDGKAPCKIGDKVTLHTTLTAYKSVVQLNGVITKVEEGTEEPVEPGETVECTSIKQALELEVNTPLTVKGKVLDVIGKSVLIYDSNEFIELRAAEDVTGIAKDDIVKVEGTRGIYKSSGAQQINATKIEKITETLTATIPTTATKVDAAFFESKTEAQLKEMHEFVEAEGKYIKDGNFHNLILDGTEKQISIKTSLTTLENGREYKVKGFASGLSGGKFLNVFITSLETIAYDPVTSIEITNGETAELFVDKSVKLGVKVLPESANQAYTFEITEGKDVVSIDGEGVVKGLKAGTAKITVKAKGNAEKTDVITITVKETPTLSGEVVTKTYDFAFTTKLESLEGGSAELGGLTWNYTAAPYLGFQGGETGRGIQVGSSKKPIKDPWTISTTLPCEVTLKSYSTFLSNGSEGSLKYEIKYGTATDTDKIASASPLEVKKEGLTVKTETFGITLSEGVKASYIKSIKLVMDVPVEYESLFNFGTTAQ